MKKFTILFFILLLGCVERPYNEAYFIGEGEDIIEPEEDIVEPEEDVYEEDTLDTYEPEEDVVEDVIEPEEDIERDTVWEFDAVEEDVVSVDADDEDTWADTYIPEDTKPQLGPGECPKDCKTWYDGCNSCQCNGGKIGGCTKMYCPTKKEPYCKKLHGT